MGGIGIEMNEFVTIISGKSSSGSRNPKKSPGIFINIINKIMWESIIHGDVRDIVLVGETLLCLQSTRYNETDIYNKV